MLPSGVANQYKIVINNPKVYYKIQLAEIVDTYAGLGDEVAWAPITLKDGGPNQTPYIEPHQGFFDNLFNRQEMPRLRLELNNGELSVRYVRGIETSLLPLVAYWNPAKGTWRALSGYIKDFTIGEFKQKFIVLYLEAKTTGPSEVQIISAQIRCPEVKLNLK